MKPEAMRDIRDQLGRLQKEMAGLLGVDLRTYQRWEAGERKIPGPVVLLVKRIVCDHADVSKNHAA